MGAYDDTHADHAAIREQTTEPLGPEEARGLAWAGVATLVRVGLLRLAVVPERGVLRNPVTGDVLDSPFLRRMIALIFVFFLLPGFAYGWVAGATRSGRDVVEGMAAAMSSMGFYIVLVFFAAQFVAFFGRRTWGH